MNEIKCPHCGTVFTIDEADYASLVQQVRTAEFENELHARLAEAEKAKKVEIKLAETKVAQQAQEAGLPPVWLTLGVCRVQAASAAV